MGCTSAKNAPPARHVPEATDAGSDEEIDFGRRLSLVSLGDIEGKPLQRFESDVEDDRSLLLHLSKQCVTALAEGSGAKGRVSSVCTRTDVSLHRALSFSPKTTQLIGEPLSAKDPAGFVCKKGKKPDSPNQDSFFILRAESDFSLYGVFDGHGRRGHDVSNFVKDNLPKLLIQEPQLQLDPLIALQNAFERTQRLIIRATELNELDASRSGTTVSVIYHDHKKNMLHIGHVGDSRIVIGRREALDTEDEWKAVDLTVDHKPNDPEERRRIEQAGGRVIHDGGWNYRVYAKSGRGPGLNMSRAMGDLHGFFNAGISATPDVNSHKVSAGNSRVGGTPWSMINTKSLSGSETEVSSQASLASYSVCPQDRFILLCSDGVWEFISSKEAVKLVADLAADHPMEAAERLARVAWERWEIEMQGQVVDDITVVLVCFGPPVVSGTPSKGGYSPANLEGYELDNTAL